MRSQGKSTGSKSGRSCSNMTSHSVHSTRRGPLRLNIWFPSTRATVVALLARSRNHSFFIKISYSFRVAAMSNPQGQMIRTSGSTATTDSTDTRTLLEAKGTSVVSIKRYRIIYFKTMLRRYKQKPQYLRGNARTVNGMHASCHLDHLRGPMSSRVDGVSPLKEHDLLGLVVWVILLGLSSNILTFLDPPFEVCSDLGCFLGVTDCCADRGDAFHDFCDGCGVESDDLGLGVHLTGDTLHTDQVNGANIAEILYGETSIVRSSMIKDRR